MLSAVSASAIAMVALPGEVGSEDALHDRQASRRVRSQAVQLDAQRGLLRGADGDRHAIEPVAVWRSTAEEPTLGRGWDVIAALTRVLIRMRSPFDMPPKRVITRSCASVPGRPAPPTSGTHSGTR